MVGEMRKLESKIYEYYQIRRFFDLLQRELVVGRADRIEQNHYVITKGLYNYLKQEGILDVIKKYKIKIEIKGDNNKAKLI